MGLSKGMRRVREFQVQPGFFAPATTRTSVSYTDLRQQWHGLSGNLSLWTLRARKRSRRGPLGEVRPMSPDHLEEGPRPEFNVCPKCDRHFRIDARTRLSYLLDDDKYEVEDNNLVSTDPLKFTDLKQYARAPQAFATGYGPERCRH